MKKTVQFETPKGTVRKVIEINNTYPPEHKEEEIIHRFNRDTRAIEWVGGCTYAIQYKHHRLKSSSLDELQEMFKCAYLKLPIPERKCFLTQPKV